MASGLYDLELMLAGDMRPPAEAEPEAADAPQPDWDRLYAAQWLPMVRLAALLVDDRSAAEDVAQDAFIALHRNYASVRDPSAAVAYLRQSVVNGARSVLRRRRVMRRHLLSPTERGDAGTLDPGLAVSEDYLDLIAAIRTLSRRQREVVVLRYWLRLSEAEIATTLGVSAGTVKSTASLALHKLKSHLGASE